MKNLLCLLIFHLLLPYALASSAYPGDSAVVREIERMERHGYTIARSNAFSSQDGVFHDMPALPGFLFPLVFILAASMGIFFLIRRMRRTRVPAGERRVTASAAEPMPDREFCDPKEVFLSAEKLHEDGEYLACISTLYQGLALCLRVSLDRTFADSLTDRELLQQLGKRKKLLEGCGDFFSAARSFIFGGLSPDAGDSLDLQRRFRALAGIIRSGEAP